MKAIWNRFLAWTYRVRHDAFLRIELQGSLDGPVDHIVRHQRHVLVFTRYSVYSVCDDYGYGSLLNIRRVA
jgi:hypothetical protein